MIVRINQFDAPRPESEAGWPSEGRLGPILAPWPEGTKAYEILILEQDEQRRPLSDSFRQQQLRHLIPQAVAALREPGEETVVRLDGPLGERELLPAYRYLTDPSGQGRFAISGVEKLDDTAKEIHAGVRIAPTPERLTALCGDSAVGLERSVRLRVLCVPEAITNTVLEIDSPDDERWADVLGKTGFVVSTVRGMLALHILTARFEAPVVKSRLMQRLTAAATAAARTPARV
jgi:hypothetical protein